MLPPFFLNSGRLNASVLNQFLHRALRNIPSHQIEARHDNGIGRIINDHIHASRALKCTDIASFFADDASFQIITRALHHRGGGFGSDLRCIALHRLRHEIFRMLIHIALGILPQKFRLRSKESAELFLHLCKKLIFGFFLR